MANKDGRTPHWVLECRREKRLAQKILLRLAFLAFFLFLYFGLGGAR